ncbi:KATNB1-like protein 1 isoform X1 [Hippocampus comes]|uniref:KATNB1-like protein 1 isoform X1 n=1 Tax=Hippocampus comes TaxID=109280 RepID=UPI00094E6F1C|nr:PREDICTED: KATNB1-like protein 1 isoform X1 [Hippocampus comes]
MDSNLEDLEDQHREATLEIESARADNKTDGAKKEESNKKSHSGNNPGRVKRVVSYKRKTRHLVMARKKPQGSGRTHDAANKDNKRQEMFDTDPQVLMPDGNHMTGRTAFQHDEYSKLAELTRDHSTITEVLLGRNLRLKVALSLWKRHFGELITYFQRIQDTGVFVDMLPLISRCLDHDSSDITIGCCVDLFPLVHKVLISPYEGYVIVGLTWIHSVLKRWREPLKASGCTGSTEAYLDRNFPVFNQQLLELWHREPKLKSFPGAAGDVAKVIDVFLSQLTFHE